MNRTIFLYTVAAFFLLIAIVTTPAWLNEPRALVYAQDEAPITATSRTVSVSGSGQVAVQPDIAIVQVGVQTSDSEASAALAANTEQMQALIAALEEAGIAQEDIQTQTIQVQPQYAGATGEMPTPPQPAEVQANQPPTITGYIATNMVEVKVNEIANLGTLLDSIVTAGGNQINGIRFEISEGAAALQQARETAWNDAQQKAEQLALLAGAELGNVLTISEFSQGPVPQAESSLATRGAGAVPIQPGTQNVNVQVQVTWQLQ